MPDKPTILMATVAALVNLLGCAVSVAAKSPGWFITHFILVTLCIAIVLHEEGKADA